MTATVKTGTHAAVTVSPEMNHFVERAPIDAVLACADVSARDMLAAATREVERLLGERGSCILLDPSPHVALALHAPAVIDLPVCLDRYPEIVAAIRERTVITVESAREDPRLARVFDQLPPDLVGISVVPLLVGERCLGVLHVQSSSRVRPAANAVVTARIVARVAALALDRRRRADQNVTRPVPVVAPAQDVPAPHTRVLLVEDDRSQADALSEALQEEGYLIDHVSDATEALRHVSDAPPQLVLLDVNLGEADGFDVAARIRASSVGREIPIVFLSGVDDLPRRVRYLDLPDIDFLPKPYSLDELLTRMAKAVNEGKVRQCLRADAERDELTGLGNLRLLRATMTAEMARADRYGTPLSLVMIDLDKLKRINDELGHLAGSNALRTVAEVLRTEIRENDLAIRYGGDEFVVVLPHTGLRDALKFAERALEHVRRRRVSDVPVSVSVGVASLVPGRHETADDLLRRADAAAYRSKRDGGDRVSFDETDTPAPAAAAPVADAG